MNFTCFDVIILVLFQSYGSSEENTSTYQVITTNEERSTGERKEKMTVDEKRFFEICRNLDQRPVRKVFKTIDLFTNGYRIRG